MFDESKQRIVLETRRGRPGWVVVKPWQLRLRAAVPILLMVSGVILIAATTPPKVAMAVVPIAMLAMLAGMLIMSRRLRLALEQRAPRQRPGPEDGPGLLCYPWLVASPL